ncbi:hypothetical protein D6833_06695 [Candidatus Parcubacteria bacterium]|nr:MAG: hypothetical protein D6833_06695 [Candidatus Parcubacteria bacterium]
MNTQKPDLRPTIFLDTNALQYMSSYLRHARTLGLPPYAEGTGDAPEYGYEDVQRTLKQHLPEGIANFVLNGCRTLTFLQQQAGNEENKAAIFTSRLSRAELLFGILDGQAHAHLAREGFSYRMRQHIRALSHLVSMYLTREDYESLVRELDELFTTLEREKGISVELVEDVVDFSSIAAFSELLQSNVFLDVLDCWMYGCAVAVQADRIVTFDTYFKQVINRIHNPQGEADWQQVQDRIREGLERLFPVETPITLSLPVVQDLPREVPRSWGGNNA